MKKSRFLTTLFSAVLLTSFANVGAAVEADPAFAQTMAIETEAGFIHFELVNQVPPVEGLFQAVASIDLKNRIFELGNGSKWSSSNIDMIRAWNEEDRLLVSTNQAIFSADRFALVNVRLGKAVPISLVRESRPTNEDALYITQIDSPNGIVSLNKNGQQWIIYNSDQGTLRRFSEHDRVLIGINTSDYDYNEKTMRYIIIDTASNQYVRATPLNR